MLKTLFVTQSVSKTLRRRDVVCCMKEYQFWCCIIKEASVSLVVIQLCVLDVCVSRRETLEGLSRISRTGGAKSDFFLLTLSYKACFALPSA